MEKTETPRPILLPGEDVPELKVFIGIGSFVGLGLGLIPPPRCFVSVASDLVQIFAILSALVFSLLILLASVDPAGDGYFNPDATTKVSQSLDRMRGKIIETLISYGMALCALIAAKIVCVWFDPHPWAAILPRVSCGFAGYLSGAATVCSLRLLRIQGHAQFMRGMIGSIRASRRG